MLAPHILARLAPTAADPRPVLLAVAGPTAVGKTALTVALARQLGTEIISADSRQFFREMSIGTAKPTPAERQGVPHHFVDSHSITEDYSAGRFAAEAEARLARLFARHPVVIATGGSGLYLQALTDGLDELPPVLPAVRQQLQHELATQGLAPLVAELAATDPIAHARLDLQNHQRVLRALEITRGTGRPFSSFHRGRRPWPARRRLGRFGSRKWRSPATAKNCIGASTSACCKCWKWGWWPKLSGCCPTATSRHCKRWATRKSLATSTAPTTTPRPCACCSAIPATTPSVSLPGCAATRATPGPKCEDVQIDNCGNELA
ncbi:tRNA (adenosine(37)-N6)-dimethylallyltransferase MiaA [Hymenobacter sp. BRD128]|nr:tRNA (adenosine(37)-N6)-dimethylallyltransferase MiaA [Hymenobacter sp. BRD128]